MLNCPFCGDNDFDLVGLKSHLLNSCEAFENTPSILEERQRREAEADAGSWGVYQHIKNRKP